MDAMEYWGRISYLKGGIVFSRLITTVSPRYAQEIQTPELGFGFDGILRARESELVGILNGIDYDQWDPERDPNIPAPYNAEKLDGKLAAKQALLERFGLPSSGAAAPPVVGLISRMVDQKGFDLLADIADELPRLGASIVLLGTGERRYEDLWLGACGALSGAYRGAHRVRRAAGAPDRGGRRPVPDAVAVRAVRAESDVQPALRDGPAGPRDRGPCRHGAELRCGHRDRDRIYVR